MGRTYSRFGFAAGAALLALSVSSLDCATGTEMPSGSAGSTGNPGAAGMITGAAGTSASGTAGNSASGAAGNAQTAGTTGSGGTSTTGTAGTQGAAGTQGSAGTQGNPGAAGRGGTTGMAGTTGAAGRGGATGAGGAPCAGTLTRCNGTCVDTTGSQTNCGGCGITCRADQTCWQSGCRCATGSADCGGTCKDVMSSTVNCGMCNNMCATGATCVMGVCQCPTDQTACSGVCRALNTDGMNCGKCGTVCGSGTSCLFGACLDPNALACTPATRANQSSARDATIMLGKYWINNNWWGASQATGSQSIWSMCQSGDLVAWGTSYNWSGTSNQVKTFASAVFGWHWGWKVTNTGLPVQISSGRRITCGWDYTLTHTGGSVDVAYDMWVHTVSMAGTNDDPTDEVMVWLNRTNGAGPIGTRMATVTLAGTTWDLHRGAIVDSSGRMRWNVFSFIRTQNAATSVMNMMEFFNDLVSRGWMASSKYVSSIQAGTEVFTGMGQLDTKGFYCRIQ